MRPNEAATATWRITRVGAHRARRPDVAGIAEIPRWAALSIFLGEVRAATTSCGGVARHLLPRRNRQVKGVLKNGLQVTAAACASELATRPRPENGRGGSA